MSLENLKAGVYFGEIETEQGSITKKSLNYNYV